VILAIDPGPEFSAYVILDRNGVPHQPCDALPRADRVDNWEMRRRLQFVDRHYSPRIVCEMVACYGQPVGKEVFQTCVWIGRYIELVNAPERFHCIERAEVKKHLCHKVVGINDSVIRQALIDRFGPGKEKAIGKKKTPGPLYGITADEWAALALGVTFLEQQPQPARA
jgi:hypothetical protein